MYDLFVIGGGSGGVAAARASAAYGAKVGLAEGIGLGGTCVNRGCVPKKLYSYGSLYAEEFHNAEFFGWSLSQPEFSWLRLQENVSNEVSRLNGVYGDMLRKAGVEVYRANAKLIGNNVVKVGEKEVHAKKLLIATGSKPVIPNIKGKEHIISSDHVFTLKKLPKSIAIVGGGYIAVEFASILNKLGVRVNLLVRKCSLLSQYDSDMQNFIKEQLEYKGINIHCNVDIAEIYKEGEGYKLISGDGRKFGADLVMYAIGRVPNVEGLGLEGLGVATDDKGAIKINEWQESNIKGIYAVGDVVDKVNLTPVAIQQARTFADTQFGGKPRIMDYSNIPTAIFSDPPISSVGLTEKEAREQFESIDVYTSNFKPMKYALDRGAKERAFIKVIVDSNTDRVLGIHMVGKDSPEIIQGFAVALKAGMTKEALDSTVGIHPSSAEELVTLRVKTRRLLNSPLKVKA